MSCIVSFASDLFTFGLNETQDGKNLHQIKSQSMRAESKYTFAEIISRLGGEDRGMLTGNFGPVIITSASPAAAAQREKIYVCRTWLEPHIIENILS